MSSLADLSLSVDDLVAQLNRIRWRSPPGMTAEADALVERHLHLMREVLERLEKDARLSPLDAYARTQMAGTKECEEYEPLLDRLFGDVSFQNAVTRENLILTIASFRCWPADSELRDLPNPWEPWMHLYEMGYTSSFVEDHRKQSITVTVGYDGGIAEFPLI